MRRTAGSMAAMFVVLLLCACVSITTVFAEEKSVEANSSDVGYTITIVEEAQEAPLDNVKLIDTAESAPICVTHVFLFVIDAILLAVFIIQNRRSAVAIRGLKKEIKMEQLQGKLNLADEEFRALQEDFENK